MCQLAHFYNRIASSSQRTLQKYCSTRLAACPWHRHAIQCICTSQVRSTICECEKYKQVFKYVTVIRQNPLLVFKHNCKCSDAVGVETRPKGLSTYCSRNLDVGPHWCCHPEVSLRQKQCHTLVRSFWTQQGFPPCSKRSVSCCLPNHSKNH